jgi:hypothetical protein
MTQFALLEYLYIDERRLNSYLDQIADPVAYDKVPILNVGLKMTGPEAGATQARFGRQRTSHEKVQSLLDYIEKEDLLIDTAAASGADDPRGRRETLFEIQKVRATRIFVPSKSEVEAVPSLTLWFAKRGKWSAERPQNREERLFLIEDFSGRDQLPRHMTGYSALIMLLHDLRSQLSQSVLADEFNLTDPEERFRREFSQNPTQVLQSLGAKLGGAREITSLYRIRATLADSDSEPRFIHTTIGYPIVIAAASSE